MGNKDLMLKSRLNLGHLDLHSNTLPTILPYSCLLDIHYRKIFKFYSSLENWELR